jgi:signal transduction histidine kinase
VALWHRRRPLSAPGRVTTYLLTQVGAGIALAVLFVGHQALLRDTIANTTLDLLHFSLHPWDTPRIALQLGLIVWHATTLAGAVLILRLGSIWWIVPRRHWRLGAIAVLLWATPLVIWQVMERVSTAAQLPLLVALTAAVVIARYVTPLKGRYRHGSQAFRLTLMTLGVVVPALAFYPALFQLAWQAKAQLVETRYGPQAVNLRQTVQKLLQQSLEEVDTFPGLADLATVPATPGEALTDRAFQVWRTTSLAAYPVTSSLELYGPEDTLVSRFAFNLPEDLTAAFQSQESTCTWDVYEEVAPFFAEERRVLHAGRALCAPDGRILGSLVVHAMLDWENLPFIASQSPYVELLRPADPLRGEGISGGDVEFAFYGWSRRPLYSSSGRAWMLEDDVFARTEQSRMPLWGELRRGEEAFDAYVQNDRGGIYVLGFPIVSALGHVVNLAELTLLAWLTYAVLLTATALFGVFSRRGATAPALLREVRASFYRKLLLAFIAATVVPVAALALAVGTYVADEMRGNVEEEAVRTASAARRVVEDLVAPRAAQQGVGVDDNLMVWVSRLIDQDVNIFSGPRLLATSERNLFASGLLPVRTPADVFRDIELLREAATVTPEQIGALEYLVAATSMTGRGIDAILTVPLASQAQEIETQIDTMYRYVLLGALLFVFGGAFIGYWLAERIADPVNRLTRATRRLARGDLDVRVAATSSDELRRLVEDFNRMAADLQHQRKELERTHRLEAWAEMARQVAHDIKNPLTPIQLNAEHLRRVHADRGEPLSPVLQDCVATILTQVKLLRQIASEFSSFASAPTAKPASVEVQELVREIVDPYRAGLSDRIKFDVDVPSNLPPIYVDRTLITRALTNLVENALHAMPATGTIKVVARSDNGVVRVRVSDTGVGMDQEALARAFEPYFSTKATGTGLGLPIAKRNVEANGGSINVVSERDRGTTVEITLPAEVA